ncbi:MAG: DUF1822 family protein [Cyanobacteria bacterium P01_A01_bin.84]
MPNSLYSQDLRLSLPEVVWLEPEHFLFAKQTSSLEMTDANHSWQVYLNTLALLALEVWLGDRLNFADEKSLPDKIITRDTNAIAIAGSLQAGEYKFCAIATEHLLDEIVNISQDLIENPESSAHFYVLLEVLEEEEEVLIRGFLPYNQLVEIKNNSELPVRDGQYQIPLSLFDIEPNHLLFYHRHVQASEFGVPVVDREIRGVNQVHQVSEKLSNLVHTNTIKLSRWFQGIIDEGWETIDSLSNTELSLAFHTRNTDNTGKRSAKRAKIIDLGIDLGSRKVTLLINISPEISSDSQANGNQGKISVLAQLYPMGGERFLPHNIKLVLLSKAGKTLQEVTSRIQDNYIQLKPFKGESGKKFSIQISLENVSVQENFEL